MGIETALVAMGMNAGTAATVASVASTAGSVLSGVSALGSLIGGAQSYKEGKQQAENAKAEAALRGQEEARIAAKEAKLERENVESTLKRQKLAYMSSGVSLEGSPLLVMEKTRERGAQNIDEIISSGASNVAAAQTEGRIKANQARSSGRREFMAGLSNAATALSGLK